MKKFYIITNIIKDPNYTVTNQIKSCIERLGGTATVAHERDGVYDISEDVDCILTLGGDGTLIRAAGTLSEYEIPFLGVNLGTLGYLTEIERDNLEEGMKILMHKTPIVEERMMIRGQFKGQEEVALNDIVLTRSGDLRTIQFHVYVNGAFLHSYRADGMIISTPTGSTGYSMSAGGPIVEPTASIFILTPICSHSLSNRSIVLSSNDVIEIELGAGRSGKEGVVEEASVSFDGGTSVDIQTGDRIRITKRDKTVKLMKISEISFLETLRRKMAGK